MIRLSHPIGRILVTIALVSMIGCSTGDTATVNGTVTLDGSPLKEGVVRFVPVDGKTPTASADIKDGKFNANVPKGEMRVELSAPKVIGKKKMYDTPDSPVVDEVAELLPERYNVNSELKITVKGGGQKETFTLESKSK
jgi:hypothetical protein